MIIAFLKRTCIGRDGGKERDKGRLGNVRGKGYGEAWEAWEGERERVREAWEAWKGERERDKGRLGRLGKVRGKGIRGGLGR